MKKLLICGINGQLGSSMRRVFSGSFEVYGLDKVADGNNVFACDITDREKVFSIFEKIKPDVVINAAALVNADLCETEKELAYKINYEGNNNLLTASKSFGSYFVFISSYYVFDGSRVEYSEDDIPTPINYYGILKWVAENEVLNYEKSMVVRPCKIFSIGYDERNFTARVYNSLKKGEEFFAVSDQYNNPVLADFISESIKELIKQKAMGIFNIGGKDFVNNYEFAKLFAEYFNLDSSLIKSVSTDKSSQKAPRPMKVKLLLSKMESKGVRAYTLDEMFKMIKL